MTGQTILRLTEEGKKFIRAFYTYKGISSWEGFPGVISQPLKVHHNNRGLLCELLRTDWKEIIRDDIQQVLLSESLPGVIRAWHRHTRGQVDYLTVIKGKVEVWIKEKKGDEPIKILLDYENPQLLRIPGHYWHGTKNVGKTISQTIYFLSKLYDYDNPDEERMEVE